MKNKKGFVMTETLVVTVFLVSIFTFIYVSIVPLLGKYEDMVNRNANIDIVYKLYHIRKMIENDSKENEIISSSLPITCSIFGDVSYCNKLMEYLELNNYLLIYTDSISNTISNLDASSYGENANKELKSYLENYKNLTGNYLILLDLNNYTIAHLKYNK